jgi:UDP-sulfoquinovose synthase
LEILVLGGDGFCGWPTSLNLADQGHHVTIVDNQSRREIDTELGVESLTPITSIEERLDAWEEVAGSDKKIDYVNLDLASEVGYKGLAQLMSAQRPDSIVHFAEQRSAPYSMKSPRTRRYTVSNNINATNNILTALVETGVDAHFVHLGTMGVYGYGQTGKAKIPEGYLNVKIPTDEGEIEAEILYPASPGSVYHNTKVMDHSMIAFAAKNDGIRSTDLHQGIVWGTQTPQTNLDPRLTNRFDYDGDYGTVLNRFLSQAAIGHPLTVHGTGGQKRAFIHIRDTVRCIELAVLNPPESGSRPAIFNQVAETHRVNELAELVAKMTGVAIEYVDNPRKEAATNELDVSNDNLRKLGLNPILLAGHEGLLTEIKDIAEQYADRIDVSKIPATSQWQQRQPTSK